MENSLKSIKDDLFRDLLPKEDMEEIVRRACVYDDLIDLAKSVANLSGKPRGYILECQDMAAHILNELGIDW